MAPAKGLRTRSQPPRKPRAKTPRPTGILVRLRSDDQFNSVSRETLREMARRLGMTETDTVHMALADAARRLGLRPQREPKFIQSAEELAEFDLSGLRRALLVGLRAEAEDRARAARRPGRDRSAQQRARKPSAARA